MVCKIFFCDHNVGGKSLGKIKMMKKLVADAGDSALTSTCGFHPKKSQPMPWNACKRKQDENGLTRITPLFREGAGSPEGHFSSSRQADFQE